MAPMRKQAIRALGNMPAHPVHRREEVAADCRPSPWNLALGTGAAQLGR
jgi:hypothetical protein